MAAGKTFYDILGVSKSASDKEIKSAFRKLAQKYHPDAGSDEAKFKEIGCEIYSVSCDTHFVHKAWHDANEKIAKIEYPMLADPTALLAKDLDTYNAADRVAERGDFIVRPEGKVVAYEVISSNVGRNAEELLRRVQASQFVYEHGDQVCPAKWTPGEETIEPSLDLVGLL